MDQHVKIGDKIEIEFGSGTTMMVVENVVSDADIRGYDKEGNERFTDISKIIAIHGNIADPDSEGI